MATAGDAGGAGVASGSAASGSAASGSAASGSAASGSAASGSAASGSAASGSAASGSAGSGVVAAPLTTPAAPPCISAATLPWIEKYRPTRLADVAGNTVLLGRLRALVAQGDIPNLILSGPPGTGKTTSMMCLARELLGSAAESAVREVNASDDRGIKVVRDTCREFAERQVDLPAGQYKLIILDEADSMTDAAQHALRHLIESHAASTRFALACNDRTKIIESLQSRCALLQFPKLQEADIATRVQHVELQEGAMAALTFTADGDMRAALNNLQAAVAGMGARVSVENICRVCDQPAPVTITEIVAACSRADFRRAIEITQGLLRDGHAFSNVLTMLLRIVPRVAMHEGMRIEFLKRIGEVHQRSGDGCGSPLQCFALLARLCGVSHMMGVRPRS